MINVYSVLDKQTDKYSNPFYAHNDTLAMRMYQKVQENPESDLAKYPQDYKLVRLGSFDERTGELTNQKESLT